MLVLVMSGDVSASYEHVEWEEYDVCVAGFFLLPSFLLSSAGRHLRCEFTPFVYVRYYFCVLVVTLNSILSSSKCAVFATDIVELFVAGGAQCQA